MTTHSHENPINISDIILGYRLKIGVMGSASGSVMRNKEAVKASRVIGSEIAKHGCTLVNGACPGLPDEAALGAKKSGGKCLGISPAISVISHINRYKSPIEHYDEFIFTGLGLMMRDIINVRSCDGVIILPGGTGTLNEFTVAYDEGKPIGILTGHGGVANHIDTILKFCNREATEKMVFSDDPVELVEKLVKIVKNEDSPDFLDDNLIGENGAVTKIEAEMAGK
jgi:uncharacterized protein (TIGR00725 family)